MLLTAFNCLFHAKHCVRFQGHNNEKGQDLCSHGVCSLVETTNQTMEPCDKSHTTE